MGEEIAIIIEAELNRKSGFNMSPLFCMLMTFLIGAYRKKVKCTLPYERVSMK